MWGNSFEPTHNFSHLEIRFFETRWSIFGKLTQKHLLNVNFLFKLFLMLIALIVKSMENRNFNHFISEFYDFVIRN